MHEEILSEKQRDSLPLIRNFSNNFGLIGGTALALQIGHRRSIDFDLATTTDLDSDKIRALIRKYFVIESILVDEFGELTLVANSVKITFLKYPFVIEFSESFGDTIKMPDILTLSAMKAFSLGQRAKWKDYVDLYFVFRKYSLSDLAQKADSIFKGEFNEKLFREQLSYFEDIDYSEEIDYIQGFEADDEVIKERLKEISLQR